MVSYCSHSGLVPTPAPSATGPRLDVAGDWEAGGGGQATAGSHGTCCRVSLSGFCYRGQQTHTKCERSQDASAGRRSAGAGQRQPQERRGAVGQGPPPFPAPWRGAGTSSACSGSEDRQSSSKGRAQRTPITTAPCLLEAIGGAAAAGTRGSASLGQAREPGREGGLETDLSAWQLEKDAAKLCR